MTYYDRLNIFFAWLEGHKLTASAQLVYLHLLHIDNKSGRTGVIEVSNSKLLDLTNLTKATIIKAKAELQERELVNIDCTNNKTSSYTLLYTSDYTSKPAKSKVVPIRSDSPEKSRTEKNAKELKKIGDLPRLLD